MQPFTRLNEASLDTARALSPLGRQARRSALDEMLATLKRVHSATAFGDARLNKRLGEVVETWAVAARQEHETLEKAPLEVGRIDNPYNPGPALELHDSLFVGRRDLAQQLGETLSRWTHRPTFLLNGERRMGNSSTLKQLPDLLGARYLPIFYDLQIRGTSSSIAAFLGTIAKEIQETMFYRGMRVNKLEYERLQRAQQRNDAAVFYIFDQWLDDTLRVLTDNERTLLLAFDEFEKLEEAGQAHFLDLKLLLDWCRCTIQKRPQLALLFSEVRTLGEMEPDWATYFVNVQTLRVSFLHPQEVRQLITRPAPNFPSEHIFGDEVIEGIIEVTGCHPFLVQAVCSALIDNLNVEKRKRADSNDVTQAVEQVLEAWWDGYFRDLWNRTDAAQRACLFALRLLVEGDVMQVAQARKRDEQQVQRALQTLCKRDLVREQQAGFRIATPIFVHWITRNQYS